MSLMNASEYFESVRDLERELRRRVWAVEHAEDTLTRVAGGTGGGMPSGGDDPSWRMADRIDAYAAQVDRLAATADQLLDAEQEAYDAIRAIQQAPNGDNMMDALQLRYICLLENDEIARRMGCTVRTLQRWVDQAFDWYDTLRIFERKPPRWL